MLTDAPIRSVRDRVLLMRSMPATGSLTDEALILIAEHAQDRSFKPGTIVMEEGNPVDTIHMVMRGLVRVTRKGLLVADADRGGGFGFLSVLGRDPWGIRAEVIEPTLTLAVPATAMLDAYEESFALVRNNLRLASGFFVGMRGNLPREVGTDTDVDVGTKPEHAPTLVDRVMKWRTGPFVTANVEALVDLARNVKPVAYKAGDTIWDIGDPATFWVRSDYGIVRCANAEGDVVRVGAEFVLGIMDALSAEPRKFSAVAETDFVGTIAHRETFLNVLETHHELAMEFLAQLSRGMIESKTGKTIAEADAEETADEPPAAEASAPPP